MMKEKSVTRIQVIQTRGQTRGKLLVYTEHYCMRVQNNSNFFILLKKVCCIYLKCDAPSKQVIQVKADKSICPFSPLDNLTKAWLVIKRKQKTCQNF